MLFSMFHNATELIIEGVKVQTLVPCAVIVIMKVGGDKAQIVSQKY